MYWFDIVVQHDTPMLFSLFGCFLMYQQPTKQRETAFLLGFGAEGVR
jgi:hypothetical protein